MLPKNLSSKYSQYKNDTDSIASWLATTARECGYVSLSKSKGPKNKGKTPPVRQTYTIPIKDFTTLAEFVATRTEPPVDVPPKFASLLDRAIAARQWYSGAISPYLPDDDKKLESDDKHAFFLSVLQKVRDILKFRYPKNHVNSKKAPKDMAEVLNMFENLELQEPSEMFEKAPDVAPSAPKAPKVTYKAERVDGLKEDFLAFYFLMSDLNALRTEVSKSWQAYQQGLMDIVVASLITNTAVDLARAMVEDLSQQFAKHGGIEKMLEAFYAAQCEEAGTKESFKERPGDDLNFRMYDIAGVAFWPAYILLNAFCKVIEEVRIPEMKPGFYGIYDPSTDWFKKNAREKFKDDKILLLELLPEFMFLARITERTPAEDEFTRGLRTMFKTKKVTLCLAYAATIFLDIHHILRGETDYCFQALSETMSVVLSNIENIQKFHKDLTIENWPQQNDEIMAAFVSEIKYYVHTDRYQIEAKRLKRINIPKPYYFLRNHPWSCGLLKYYIQTNFRDLSITFVNAWGSVMSCQHLYNAARNDKLLTKSWPDMDLCFAIQGPEPFFVGSPPTSPDDYLKRFILAMGGSATNFVAKNNRKKKGVKVSKRGPQSLKELAPVLSTFRARYCAETMRFELKTEDVERILEKSEWQYEMDENDMLMTSVKDDEKVPGMQKPITKQLPVKKLMAILRAALQAEIMELSYDYLTLHRFCWRLLRSVKEHCRELLIKMYGPDYIEKENQLPFIVGYILMAATTTDKLAGFLKIKTTNEVTSALLAQAADAINTMLETSAGGIVSMILREKFGIQYEFEEDSE